MVRVQRGARTKTCKSGQRRPARRQRRLPATRPGGAFLFPAPRCPPPLPGETRMDRSFWKAGHTPTLLSAFLYFDLSFMVWYLLGPMQVQIAQALQLDTQQRALMVAVPILCGAVLRLFLG